MIPRIIFISILFPVAAWLYFHFLKAPLDHHIVETIIDMNRIQKDSIWDYHYLTHAATKPLFYFIAHFLYQLSSLSALQAFAVTGVMMAIFLIVTIQMVSEKILNSFKGSLLAVFFFFLSFKYLHIMPLILEDNLSFYGFLIWFYYFFSISQQSFRLSFIAGLTLGGAASFHGVCNIFFIAIFPVMMIFRRKGFDFDYRKFLVIPLVAMALSIPLTELMPDAHANLFEIIDRIVKWKVDTNSSLMGNPLGPVKALMSTLGKYLNGLDHENDGYTWFYYYTNYALFYLLLGCVVWKTRWQNRKIYYPLSGVLIAVVYLLSYGATRTMRWDVLSISLLFYYLQVYADSRSVLIKRLVIFICLFSLMDIFLRPLKSVPIDDSCHKDIYYTHYLKEYDSIQEQGDGSIYILPWEYIAISGHMENQLGGEMKRVFFLSPDGRYFKSRSILFPEDREFIRRGEEMDFFISKDQQKRLQVPEPVTKGAEYRSPYLKKRLTNCLPVF